MPTPPYTPAERPGRSPVEREASGSRNARAPNTSPPRQRPELELVLSPRRASLLVRGLARSSGTIISSTGRTVSDHAHVHELHSALSEPRESVARFVERRKTTGRRYDPKTGITARGRSSRPVRTGATWTVEAGREDRAADIRPASVSTARAVALSRLPDSALSSGNDHTKKSTTKTATDENFKSRYQVNAASLTRSRPRPHGTSRADRHGAAHDRGVFSVPSPPAGSARGRDERDRTRRDFR